VLLPFAVACHRLQAVVKGQEKFNQPASAGLPGRCSEAPQLKSSRIQQVNCSEQHQKAG
jgi:hypothetical protein